MDGNNDGALSAVSSVRSVLTADGIADPTNFKIKSILLFSSVIWPVVFSSPVSCMWELVQTLGGRSNFAWLCDCKFQLRENVSVALIWKVEHYTYTWLSMDITNEHQHSILRQYTFLGLVLIGPFVHSGVWFLQMQ